MYDNVYCVFDEKSKISSLFLSPIDEKTLARVNKCELPKGISRIGRVCFSVKGDGAVIWSPGSDVISTRINRETFIRVKEFLASDRNPSLCEAELIVLLVDNSVDDGESWIRES